MYYQITKLLLIDLLKFADRIKVKDSEERGRLFYCTIRNKYLVAQPEEMVRQCCIHYLLEELNYPKSKLQVERSLKIFGVKRRFDIIGYDQNSSINLLVECKAFTSKLKDSVAQQIALYNADCNSNFIWITNGKENFFFEKQSEDYIAISTLPSYSNRT